MSFPLGYTPKGANSAGTAYPRMRAHRASPRMNVISLSSLGEMSAANFIPCVAPELAGFDDDAMSAGPPGRRPADLPNITGAVAKAALDEQ